MKNLIKEIITLIVHFSAIAEEKWCIGIRDNGQGQRCAHGHCYNQYENPDLAEVFGYSKNEQMLRKISRKYRNNSIGIADINNWRSSEMSDYMKYNMGLDHMYNQETPKQRVLAFLNDCLTKELEEINQKLESNEKIVYVSIDQVVKDLQKVELQLN